MKKNLFIGLFVMIAICNSAKAQYGYLRVAGGYSWNAFQKTGQVLTFLPGKNTDPAGSIILPMFNADSVAGYRKNINDGYARGGSLSLFGGYMINPYFGIEMGLTYLWGASISSESKIYNDGLLGTMATLSSRTNSNGLSLMPGLYFRAAKPKSKIAPYARVGLSLPVFGSTNHDIKIDAPHASLNIGLDVPVTSEISVSTQSTVSLGVNGGVGISYTPIPILSIFGEMNAQYLFVRPQLSKLTKYNLTVSGKETDMLPTTTKYSLETEFVDELTNSSNTTVFGNKERLYMNDPVAGQSYVDENKPRQELRQSANFSAIGFSIGIGVNLSKMIFKDPTGNKKKNSTSE